MGKESGKLGLSDCSLRIKLAVSAQKNKLTIQNVFLFSVFDKNKEMCLGKPIKKIDG